MHCKCTCEFNNISAQILLCDFLLSKFLQKIAIHKKCEYKNLLHNSNTDATRLMFFLFSHNIENKHYFIINNIKALYIKSYILTLLHGKYFSSKRSN
jgi:hypothetical protein